MERGAIQGSLVVPTSVGSMGAAFVRLKGAHPWRGRARISVSSTRRSSALRMDVGIEQSILPSTARSIEVYI